MKISHIEHLGIAVQSIEESLPFFTDVRKACRSSQTCWVWSVMQQK